MPVTVGIQVIRPAFHWAGALVVPILIIAFATTMSVFMVKRDMPRPLPGTARMVTQTRILVSISLPLGMSIVDASHAKRETLAIYQHVALDGQLEERYQKAFHSRTRILV